MKEAYSLWVDDQSFDPNAAECHPPPYDWVIPATSAEEAILIIKEFGAPCFLELDSNLGLNSKLEDSSRDVVRYLYSHYSNHNIEFKIRCPNTPNGEWLFAFMLSWRKIKGFHYNGRYVG